MDRKKSTFKILILLLFIFGFSSAQPNYFIKDHGRRIQLDGFLLEWKHGSSLHWYNDSLWLWDVINTPEGVTGYIKSKVAPGCSNWTFVFNNNSRKFNITINKDTISKEHSDLFQVDRQTLSTSGIVITEWVIPWDSLKADSSGIIKIHLTGFSACGDTLDEFTISTSQNFPEGKSVWSGTAIRLVLVAVLAIIFITMRRKIRKRRSRKESPHQSA